MVLWKEVPQNSKHMEFLWYGCIFANVNLCTCDNVCNKKFDGFLYFYSWIIWLNNFTFMHFYYLQNSGRESHATVQHQREKSGGPGSIHVCKVQAREGWEKQVWIEENYSLYFRTKLSHEWCHLCKFRNLVSTITFQDEIHV